ncbi:hypothetical protein ElyMa_003554700 [Elysia marginata]|uniref:Uncharacterized protein n=1 Tax=Elysia marginata TaxID=1093978 RepID=A0AAV4EJP6_9GAST|nr:hypothetical protein ElyMa_003554700 [Elysia marginata]
MSTSFVIYGMNIKSPDRILVRHGELKDLEYYHIPVIPIVAIFLSTCTFQALWVMYVLVVIAAKGVEHSSRILPHPVLSLNAFASLLNIVWLLEMDNHVTPIAFATQISVFATLLGALVIVYQSFELLDSKRLQRSDILLTRIFFHNGIAYQTAWAFELAIINLGLTVIATNLMTQYDAAFFSVSVLGVVMTLYTIIDCTLLSRWTLYTFSPYILHLMITTGIFVTWLHHPAIILLVVAVASLVFKVSLFTSKVCNDHLGSYSPENPRTDAVDIQATHMTRSDLSVVPEGQSASSTQTVV